MDQEVTRLSAIVAMGRKGEIGLQGDMPWHLPEDLRHFKETTLGHPVIMGRATWQSLPRRPLPGRRNIVLTRDAAFADEGAERAASVEEALEMIRGEEAFILGGGKVYAATMPLVSRVYATRIEADFPQADTFFPSLEGWQLAEQSPEMTSKTGLRYCFQIYEKEGTL